MMDIKRILPLVQMPNYVPPTTPHGLGVRLFEAGKPIDACISVSMRRGWLWAWRASSDALTSAYLVANGAVQ